MRRLTGLVLLFLLAFAGTGVQAQTATPTTSPYVHYQGYYPAFREYNAGRLTISGTWSVPATGYETILQTTQVNAWAALTVSDTICTIGVIHSQSSTLVSFYINGTSVLSYAGNTPNVGYTGVIDTSAVNGDFQFKIQMINAGNLNIYQLHLIECGDTYPVSSTPFVPVPTATAVPTSTPPNTPVPTATAIATSTPGVPTATAIATSTPPNTPVPTATRIPSSTPGVPTATAVPTSTPPNTPVPTATAIPTSTPGVPTATAVPTDTPVNTPVDTATAVPTATPPNTPLPTWTTAPSITPVSGIVTWTPAPTISPQPTSTPAPTATPIKSIIALNPEAQYYTVGGVIVAIDYVVTAGDVVVAVLAFAVFILLIFAILRLAK